MYITGLSLPLRHLNEMAYSVYISFVRRDHFYASPLHSVRSAIVYRIKMTLVNHLLDYQRLKVGLKGYHLRRH